jgi:hypothetical protein
MFWPSVFDVFFVLAGTALAAREADWGIFSLPLAGAAVLAAGAGFGAWAVVLALISSCCCKGIPLDIWNSRGLLSAPRIIGMPHCGHSVVKGLSL